VACVPGADGERSGVRVPDAQVRQVPAYSADQRAEAVALTKVHGMDR
jgi:hypothetical protein